ncbi:hypothetical protein HYX10_01875 [Candidatus Woesearchaeota archaeon]|nr:hypothetical protein [Candidatus Woesearchaeota archaeon]
MKIDIEKALLVAFFILMLWIGIGTFWQHELKHEFPYGYSSADAYQHQVRAEWVKHNGYAYESPAIVSGYDDVIGYYMPGAFHLTGMFSHLSGMESYDALLFLAYFVAVMAAFIMYYALRSYDRNIAILSMPLMPLIFAKTFYMGIIVGQLPFIFGTLFLVSTFWALTKLKWQKSWIMAALFVAAVALTHTSELIFVVGLVGAAFLLSLMKKDWGKAKELVTAGVVAAAASIYYLIIFSFTWGKQFGYKFFVERVNLGFPNVTVFGDFQLWIIFLLMIGLVMIYFRNIVISVAVAAVALAAIKLLDIPGKLTNDAAALGIYFAFIAAYLYVLWARKPEFAEAFAPYMLIIGFSNFIGFGPRAMQTRFMWPITLAPLFGIAAYKIIMLAKNSGKIKWSSVYTMAIAVALTIAILAMNYQPLSTQGTMYKERWEMFEWLQDNADETKVMFFYGDGYSQTSMLYNAGTENFVVNMEDYVAGLNSGTIVRENRYGKNVDYGPGLPYRKGVFSFGYHLLEDNYPKTDPDICAYDYYVFDKVTGQQQAVPLIQYNLAIRQAFLQSGMEEVMSNQAASVLRNNNKGGDCIGAA